MLVDDFRFRDKFHESLADSDIEMAIQMVETQFSGLKSLWQILLVDEREAKRKLCYNYLVAWWLCNMYPTKVKGIASNAGMPLSGKRIENLDLKFANMTSQSGSLKALETNVFGVQALEMIQSAPELYTLFP